MPSSRATVVTASISCLNLRFASCELFSSPLVSAFSLLSVRIVSALYFGLSLVAGVSSDWQTKGFFLLLDLAFIDYVMAFLYFLLIVILTLNNWSLFKQIQEYEFRFIERLPLTFTMWVVYLLFEIVQPTSLFVTVVFWVVCYRGGAVCASLKEGK